MQIKTRAEAMQDGLPRYFTGKPCLRGHVAERSVANSTCFECKRAADQRQYLKDPQKFVRKAAVWTRNNQDRVLAMRARPEFKRKTIQRAEKWREQNAERHRATSRKWYRDNPEKAFAMGRNRRARELGAEGSHCASDIERLVILQRRKCANCKCSIAKSFHIDHIMPLFLGGSNWPHNLQLLCPLCNQRKHAKHPIRWKQEQGALL